MAFVNENYLKLPGNYLFAEVSRRVTAFRQQHPEADIIRLGIGDVTRPLVPAVIESMHKAVDDMSRVETFKGYGPDGYGYDFLRKKILEYDYAPRGVELDEDEVFVSDGAKSDTANIQEIFGLDNIVALTDPVYPVYMDSNVMAGRTGDYKEDGRFERITYLPCNAENNFIPVLPDRKVDMIYLCFPNNPTGMTLPKTELRKWVEYARENRAVILYDSAYEAYIREDDVARSIYEIDGAKEAAIEFRSFSKTAGFTGSRCAYTVVPKQLMAYTKKGEAHSLNKMWFRRQTTKYNGAPYIIQRGAEATYTPEGRAQSKTVIDYYMENAAIIRNGVESAGIRVFGGVNAPYIWLKTPNGMDSWDFFDMLLNDINIVGTPGSGFGPSGRGYFRLTAFGTRENTIRAVERIKNLKFQQ